jgi:tRNA/tmRNA/rRNA uracil-C5-methylase (TrmA/RlmC/RlmD family)
LFDPPILKQVLSFFQKNNIPFNLITDGFESTRLKAKLAVRKSAKIGLFKKGTHEVIDIPNCLVHHPSINQAVLFLRQKILEENIPLYAEASTTPSLRYIQLFVDRKTNLIQLTLVLNGSATTPEFDRFCNSLLSQDLWHSIWINFNISAQNQIFGPTWNLFWGETFLWQTLKNTEIAFHPASFSQIHLNLFEQMLETIESWIPEKTRLLELYAGVGAIGLSLAHKCERLVLVENNPFSKLSFEASLKKLSAALQKSISYYALDASKTDLSDSSTILVDPPRKGLDPHLLNALSQVTNKQLIYVSCSFERFERDCKALLHSGWKLKEAKGYLLFPGTNSIETVALLEKESG